MPSSSRPYQSKMLTFVLQQWQQGLERQQRAWRQLQSTAVLGAQVAIFPIYVVLRTVEQASLALGSDSDEQGLTSEQAIPAKGKVTDLNHSLTAILTHTQQILSPKQKSQLAIPPQRQILQKADSLLSRMVKTVERLLPETFRVGHLTTIPKAQQKPGRLAQRSSGISRIPHSELMQNGHTLASSLKNRHLVLVNPGNQVFDIFTPKQQADLKHYIFRIMHAYWHSQTSTHRPVRKLTARNTHNTILAMGTDFLAALPMEFKKTWAQLTPGPQSPQLPALETSPEPRSRILPPYPSAAIPNQNPVNRLPSNAADPVEARIHSASYLEHPLETLLRWIDRILTWCEHRWQEWHEHKTNIG